MNKPDFYAASDYAELKFKFGEFYYGYEHSICHECGKRNNGEFCEDHPDADRDWCFVADIEGKEIVIPFSRLGCKDMYNVVDCLNTGIGWILAKHKLKLE